MNLNGQFSFWKSWNFCLMLVSLVVPWVHTEPIHRSFWEDWHSSFVHFNSNTINKLFVLKWPWRRNSTVKYVSRDQYIFTKLTILVPIRYCKTSTIQILQFYCYYAHFILNKILFANQIMTFFTVSPRETFICEFFFQYKEFLLHHKRLLPFISLLVR